MFTLDNPIKLIVVYFYEKIIVKITFELHKFLNYVTAIDSIDGNAK